MIVVAHDRPRMQIPFGFRDTGEKQAPERIKPVGSTEEMSLLICASGNHVDALSGHSMRRTVWPIIHAPQTSETTKRVQPRLEKAASSRRTP